VSRRFRKVSRAYFTNNGKASTLGCVIRCGYCQLVSNWPRQWQARPRAVGGFLMLYARDKLCHRWAIFQAELRDYRFGFDVEGTKVVVQS
jgi:hypothetical protein